MREIALALFAFLAFLLPVAIYCFVLAAINRRSRPFLVSGTWDAIGLLAALSGFFLATLPTIGFVFLDRVIGVSGLGWNALVGTLGYYLLVICGSVLMILSRSSKTVIYNVDPELFAQIAPQTFAALGLATKLERNRMVLTPMEPTVDEAGSTDVIQIRPRPAAVADSRYAEVAVEAFASMCNVTLHWGRFSAGMRAELERELDKNLESGAPLDNSAAAWFVSVSGMIFGAVLVIAGMFAFMMFFGR
jgi:hypothetical protein